jgi:YVTN family beta-propeller protein
MRRIIISSAFFIGITFLFSCQKNDTGNTDNSQVTYDAAYVVNGGSNSISVINLKSNRVEKTIDLANLTSIMGSGMMNGNMENMWPHQISLSPDKSKLAIAAPGMDFSDGHAVGNMQAQGKILVLNAITGELLKEITLEGIARNAAFSLDGKELWTALMMTKGKVMVFDAKTYQLVNTIPVGNMPAEVTFSIDGSKAFVANGMSKSVTVIDAVNKQVLDTLQVGNDPVGAWPGMDGMMYVDNEDGKSISVINSMDMTMMDTIHLGFMPGMVAQNNMMNEMWVSDPDGSKVHYWMNQDSGYVHGGAFDVGNGAYDMVFNSDGTTCYVTNQSEGTVSVVDVPNHQEMLKITVGNKPNGMVIRYK